MKFRINQKIFTWFGITALFLFLAIYGVELFSHDGPPVTIAWLRAKFGTAGLIALNILVVLAFLALLPYRRSTIGTWKSKGVFVAFVIALMTEMFGWPLLIFLLSPVVEVPSLREWSHRVLGHTGPTLGTWISMIGLLLIALGWRESHRFGYQRDLSLYKKRSRPLRLLNIERLFCTVSAGSHSSDILPAFACEFAR